MIPMMLLRRILCFWVLFSFLGTSIVLPPSFAQSSAADLAGLSFRLPKPGIIVNLSPAFEPVLIKGLKIHPEDPFLFDFIVDHGDQKLSAQDFQKTSQRLVNYFLAALAVPQKDLWVNLSPVEKGHIIPDTLIRTELGRDLLAEDYILKQVSASLIYPDSDFGRKFWDKVYAKAYQQFGVTKIPVNVINKIWILPEKATVYERGNTVYIVKAHLKVMLEEDYLAQRIMGNPTTNDVSKQVMREVVVPLVEREVNENKNFAQVRQVFYALILAQWYQDVFKRSIVNKVYSGRNKVAGIDVSDPKNKDLIYQEYLSAYKKGVFNYIKEETDRITQQPVPRKYFSGGFIGQHVDLAMASGDDLAKASAGADVDDIRVNLKAANSSQVEALPEDTKTWGNDLTLPLKILEKLQSLISEEKIDQEGLRRFLEQYSAQVDHEIKDNNPVQGSWPIEKTVSLLKPEQERKLDEWIEKNYPSGKRTRMMEQLLLMAGKFTKGWVKSNARNLVGVPWYFLSMEINFKAGGLGPVNVTHSKFLKALGVDVRTVQPKYKTRFDTGKEAGEPLDYVSLGFTEMRVVGDFYFNIGDRKKHAQVWDAVDPEGTPTYLIEDITQNAPSDTETLYMYDNPEHNPISKQESMAFFNLAAAKWIDLVENKREQKLGKAYELPVLHTQDGQMGLFISVIKSLYPALRDAPTMATTHTILNVGENGMDAVKWFLKDMLGISARYITASIMDSFFNPETGEPVKRTPYVQHTKAMMQLADVVTGVSFSHARDMSKWYGRDVVPITNGDDPVHISTFSRESLQELQAEGKIAKDAEYEQLLPQQVQMVKERSAERFNRLKILTASGEDLRNEAQKRWPEVKTLEDLNDEQVDNLIFWANRMRNLNISTREELRNEFYVRFDPKGLIMGNARRLVFEKNNFDPDLIMLLVRMGFDVVFFGNHQGKGTSSEQLAPRYKSIQADIRVARKQARANGDLQSWSGSFNFDQHFTEEQKIAVLGMVDGYFVANKRHLGAHEITEENPGPNYAYMIALDHRDGGTTDWLIPVDFQKPGSGSLIMLKDGGSPQEWIDQGFKPWKKLFDEDKIAFFQNAILSMKMNRVQQGQLTAAGYIWTMNDFLEQKKQYREADRKAAADVLRLTRRIPNAKQQVLKVLHSGPILKEEERGHSAAFYFNHTEGAEKAPEVGLEGFLSEINRVEDGHGYNALFEHLKIQPSTGRSNYHEFLKFLFRDMSPEVQAAMEDWLNKWDRMPGPLKAKDERLQAYLNYLKYTFNLYFLNPLSPLSRTSEDAAMAPGGIKLDNILMERQGSLMADVLSDQAQENMLAQASGLYGVIVGITPISNLPDFIQ